MENITKNYETTGTMGGAKPTDLSKEMNSVETENTVVAETTLTPSPVKSMTPIHIGLFVGGLVVGYYAFKMMKK